MRLIYLTSQKYPSKKVDPFYWKSMAGAFQTILGDNFRFVIRGAEIEQLNTIGVPAPNKFKSLYYFFNFPNLVRKYGWNEADVVIFASDSYLLPGVIFWKKVFNFKYRVVSDWHQMFDDWRDKYIALNSDLLIATSKKLKSLVISKLKVEEDKVLVAYGGVDPELFKKKINIDLPRDKFLVGYVGGFKSVGLEKGLRTIIESLLRLGDEVMAVFVGGSRAEIAHYQSLAETLEVSGKCLFVEKQPFEKVVQYEMSMDVLVIPYPDEPHFRDYGFPLKVWEYMAAKRPIVYSDLQIISEVLYGKGVPFTPGNPESLANAILSVQKSRPSVSYEPYTWQDRAGAIINFITY